MSRPTAVSDRASLREAEALRAVMRVLEAGVWLVLAASALAFGAVHEWVYVPLWIACGALLALLVVRTRLIEALRRRAGSVRITFHTSGRWLVLGEGSPYGGATGWSLDLARPALPRGPLLLPGLLFAAWALVQLVPLPPFLQARPPGMPPPDGWAPLSIAPAATGRGICFLLALLALHLVARAVLDRHAPRERLRHVVAWLGFALAVVGLAQKAAGLQLIYGSFRPVETPGGAAIIFGPFVNRNHYAAWMLMAAPIACGLLARAWTGYAHRVGPRANLRRRLLALESEEGFTLLFAFVPALATVAALVATNSRGGILAFLAGSVLAAVSLRSRAGIAVLFPVALFATALAWFGVEQVGARFERAFADSAGRTIVWTDTLERMDGLWLAGSGFNTFQFAMSRTRAWTLPEGATPWSELEQELADDPRGGIYRPEGSPGWYREAHNDYLQLLVEAGLPGVLLLGWALLRVLRAQRGDPWVLAGLAAVMLHCLVDFPAQIPAVVALFVTLGALPPRGGQRPDAAEAAAALAA